MKKIYNPYFDESYYYEQLDNGLKVIIFEKEGYLLSTCSLGVAYGSLDLRQIHNNEIYNFHPGIAHFLEHKVFETKGEDIMNKFSKMGANCNAYTSLKETIYYFSTTNSDLKKPLNLLLDTIEDFEISSENVEKEKGIIEQEVAMYEEIPDQVLLKETYNALYFNNPLIYDIGGNSESIYAIDKNELQLCHKLNYHPSNLVLLITTYLKHDDLIKIIKDNQNNKNFKYQEKAITIDYEEPIEVKEKRVIKKMDIAVNKHVYGIKLENKYSDPYEAFKDEWIYRMIFEAHFSSLNPKYQDWLDQNLINDYFGYTVDFSISYANILFYIENDDEDVLINLINDSLKEELLDADLLEQIKRRNIGIYFDSLDDMNNFGVDYLRDYLSGLDFFKCYEILNSISYKDIYKVYKSLNFPHFSYISLVR